MRRLALAAGLLLATATWAQQPVLVEQRGGLAHRYPTALAWSPDATLLAVAYSASVAVWRPADRVLLATAPLPPATTWPQPDRPVGLAFSPDGRLLAVAAVDRINLLDPLNGQVRGSVGRTGWPGAGFGVARRLAFSADGRWLAGCVEGAETTGANGRAAQRGPSEGWWLADAASGELRRCGALGRAVTGLTWQGSRLTIERADRRDECWDADADAAGPEPPQRPEPPGEYRWTPRVITSPDGRFTFDPSRLKEAVNPQYGQRPESSTDSCTAEQVSPDSRLVAALWQSGRITLHAVPSLRPRLTFPARDACAGHAVVANSGAAVAISVGSSTIAVWRKAGGAQPLVLDRGANDLAGFTPDERGLVLHEVPKTNQPPRTSLACRRLDLASGALTPWKYDPAITPTHSGARLLLAGARCDIDYPCRLTWTSNTGHERSLALPVPGDDGWASVVTVSADRARAFVAAGQSYDHTTGRLFCVDLRAARILWTATPAVDVMDAALSADGQKLVAVAGMQDAEEFWWRQLILFDATSGKLLDGAPLPMADTHPWFGADPYNHARAARRRPADYTEPARRILAHVPLSAAAQAPPPPYELRADGDGRLLIIDTASGSTRGSVTIEGAWPPRRVNWLVTTPDGHWDASPEAEAWVRFRVGDKLLGIEAGAELRVPGLLPRLLFQPTG